MGTRVRKAKKKLVGRFAAPGIADKYPDRHRIGASMTGMKFDEVEIICELNELRELLTSVWFAAISRRRAREDKPIKLTIITEIP